MDVADVMCRDVISVAPATPLKDVARLLVEHNISGLPVVDAEGVLLGVVSEGDIVSKERGVAPDEGRRFPWLFASGDRDAQKREARTAADAMTQPAIVVEPHRPLAEAARLMVERSVNRLPVVRAGELVGIVTRADLVRAFTRTDEELEREIRDEVLLRTLWIVPTDLRITVTDGIVSLAGLVDTRTDAELIPSFVARVPGVVSVDDSKLEWRIDDTERRFVSPPNSARNPNVDQWFH